MINSQKRPVCSNFYADIYANEKKLSELFPEIIIARYFNRGIERFRRAGVYAEPYSEGSKNHFMLRVVGNCPHLKAYGWYRGRRGGFECTSSEIPPFCVNKFQK